MNIPPALIYINNDISSKSLETLVSQLFISETITDLEFIDRLTLDPNYIKTIHGSNLRVIVLKDFVLNTLSNELADIVMIISHGMAGVFKDNSGPPGLTLPINKLYIHELLRYNNSEFVVNLPAEQQANPQPALGGVFALQSRDRSGVYLPNPDNELHNKDFINRKP